MDIFVDEAVRAVNENGGKAARNFATDMCDGIAQGHDGINYSLAHREAITNLVEAQCRATTFDGGVFIASCDKAMPAMLMSIGRLKDMSAIVVTGGVMEAYELPREYTEDDPGCKHNELLTLEQIGKFAAQYERKEIPKEQMDYYKHHACPSCGACSFMGTASTMQVMAEALGLMLPGTALMPATAPELKQAAYDAGKQLMKLIEQGIHTQDIVDMRSFENAIMVHAAISGSTNSLMHIPAIANEFGFEIDADTFDRMHRGAHYLLNIRPAGDWPAQYFYYAGGVPRIMEEIKSMLHLDARTVTGKTLGENLEELKKNGFCKHCDEILAEKSRIIRKTIKRTDIIASFDHLIGYNGTIAMSGLVKGVGPRFAGRIVKQFSADTLNVIEENPDRLLEVDGIGKVRVEWIKKSWQEQKEIKNIMLFLQNHDVSTSHATKIYKTYGNESIKVVQENPYRLADDIWGIGFRTADTIAEKMGFGHEKYVRLRSGILYTLNKLSEEGHCYATRDMLLKTGAELLSVEENVLSMTLDEMIRTEDVITEQMPLPENATEDDTPEKAIYLPPFYFSERGAAKRLVEIFGNREGIPIDPIGLGERISLRTGMQYDEVQMQAILTAVQSKVMVLTGGPGRQRLRLALLLPFRKQARRSCWQRQPEEPRNDYRRQRI